MVSPLVTHLPDPLALGGVRQQSAQALQIRAGRLVEMDELACVYALLGVFQVSLDVRGLDRHQLDGTVVENFLEGEAAHTLKRFSFPRLGRVRPADAREVVVWHAAQRSNLAHRVAVARADHRYPDFGVRGG